MPAARKCVPRVVLVAHDRIGCLRADWNSVPDKRCAAQERAKPVTKNTNLLTERQVPKMKRYGKTAIVVVVAIVGSYVAFGQQQGGMMGGGMMNRGGSQRGMMQNRQDMPAMSRMRGMMAQGMAQSMTRPELVATSDGGVCVLVGGKLMKYDGQLNLVKEAELKVDYEGMQQKMQKMMKNMPMMRRGMMRSAGRKSEGDGTQ